MTHTANHPEQTAERWRTIFVDGAKLEKRAAPDERSSGSRPCPRPRRILGKVEDQVQPLRANVQDAARAVVQWVASVCRHDDDQQPLDQVLDECLRPGPDVAAVNYEALARQINLTLNLDLSAKRVQTAVEHLRDHQIRAAQAMPHTLRDQLDALRIQLDQHHQALLRSGTEQDAMVRRQVAVGILAAVRVAAGRVIDHGYGEGIPAGIDLDQLEDVYLDFVRDMAREDVNPAGGELHRLLVTINEYDGSSEADMRLVVDGSRVVTVLAGPGSLPGVLAQLNVLVAGRRLIPSDVYVPHLLRLADAAESLHDDPATTTLLNWVRRQPEDQRLPTPLRVCSYALNNAATHLLERLFTAEITGTEPLDVARRAIDRIRLRDSGFALLPVTQLILLAVAEGEDAVQRHFARLDEPAALTLLENLAKFESCRPLVRVISQRAIAAQPALRAKWLAEE